ncbi:hypothetical protein WA026_014150 [Henosepilachna vigintioctopunctata]|uniref:MATH domain-containing protein n=1 Tax=Henosepilachna vigintioctopunctata TaxID=420089 RepID=A0AAW1TTF8_9CUCU
MTPNQPLSQMELKTCRWAILKPSDETNVDELSRTDMFDYGNLNWEIQVNTKSTFRLQKDVLSPTEIRVGFNSPKKTSNRRLRSQNYHYSKNYSLYFIFKKFIVKVYSIRGSGNQLYKASLKLP